MQCMRRSPLFIFAVPPSLTAARPVVTLRLSVGVSPVSFMPIVFPAMLPVPCLLPPVPAWLVPSIARAAPPQRRPVAATAPVSISAVNVPCNGRGSFNKGPAGCSGDSDYPKQCPQIPWQSHKTHVSSVMISITYQGVHPSGVRPFCAAR